MMRYKIGNKSVNALVTPLFYLFYTGGFGEYHEHVTVSTIRLLKNQP